MDRGGVAGAGHRREIGNISRLGVSVGVEEESKREERREERRVDE
jgi:hypothetical protein